MLLLRLSLHSTKRDGKDRGIVGGSPAAAAAPRRLEVVDVVQPVRFFDLTPGAIAGIYAESAGARGGPGQGRHSNVGAGSGTRTRRRRIIVQWHSHRRPAASEGDRRGSGLSSESRGPSFAFVSRCLKTCNSTTPSGCPPQTAAPFLPHDDFVMFRVQRSKKQRVHALSVSQSPTAQWT